MHCALLTLLTHTVFKREGISEDFAHFYSVGSNIFSARKVGIFWNGRFYLCGLNLRGTCRKLKGFLLCFQMSRLFRVDAWTQSSLSWCGSLGVNNLMLQLLWKMSLDTGGNGRFFIYVIDKAILIPLIPGFARLLLHMCLCMLALPNAFCSRLVHLLYESNARAAILPHWWHTTHWARFSGNSWFVKQMHLFGNMFVFMVFHQ